MLLILKFIFSDKPQTSTTACDGRYYTNLVPLNPEWRSMITPNCAKKQDTLDLQMCLEAQIGGISGIQFDIKA